MVGFANPKIFLYLFMETKNKLQSKTLWIGSLLLIAEIAGYLAEKIEADAAFVGIATGVIMIVLRFFTTKPIK